MVTHEDSKKAEGFRGGVNRSVVEMTKGKIRVGARIVKGFGRAINSVAKSNGTLTNEVLMCPWLPGQHWFKNYWEEAPSTSRGGVNESIVRLGTRRMAWGKLLWDTASAILLSSPDT